MPCVGGAYTIEREREEQFCLKELLAMSKERISEGARVSTIKIISTEAFVSTTEVLKLRGHVTHVEYRLDDDGQ